MIFIQIVQHSFQKYENLLLQNGYICRHGFLMIKRILLLNILLVLTEQLSAQLDNRIFSMEHPVVSSDSGRWKAGLFHLGYTRNTEYENLLKKGRTLLGYQLLPSVVYQISPTMALKAGIFYQQDFGNNRPTQIQPVYQFKYQKKAHTFIFGTLDGTLQHQLIEPLYDFERVITQALENGLQYKVKTKMFHSDIWVDWRKMIYPGSDFSEEFTAGGQIEYSLIKNKLWELSIPLQGTVTHRGGEIDVSGQSVLSLYNSAAGGKLSYRPLRSQNFQHAELSVYGTYYLDGSSSVADTFMDGNGSYASLNLKWRYLNLMLNYWDSYQFQSPLGDPVFHSVSDKFTQRWFFARQMVMLRAGYERAIHPHFSILGRVQVMYDVPLKSLDQITEFYLRYRRTFDLGQAKK